MILKAMPEANPRMPPRPSKPVSRKCGPIPATGKLRYTQQAATQYATKVQQRLDQQLGKIQAPAPVGVNRIDPIRGSGVVTARLPNGRTTQLMLSPPLATQRDVNRLTQQININDARQTKSHPGAGQDDRAAEVGSGGREQVT